jgi:hypothetical protein
MRFIEFRAYRRPQLAAIGWGINVASVMNLLAMRMSGEIGKLPGVVRVAPALGMGVAVVLTLLALRGSAHKSEPP